MNTRHMQNDLIQESAPVFELRDVTKCFAGETALNGVSLAIYPGQVVLLHGSKGSGKSTALRLLAGLEKPDEGTVRILGQDVTDMPLEDRQHMNRRLIGLGLQDAGLDKNRTIQDNLLELADSFEERDLLRIGAIAKWFGIAGGKNFQKKASKLSGGQQQQVALTRAFSMPRPGVLLDEPTASIDPSGKADTFRVIKKIGKIDNAAILVISHDIQAVDTADRIIRFEDGKIVPEDFRTTQIT